MGGELMEDVIRLKRRPPSQEKRVIQHKGKEKKKKLDAAVRVKRWTGLPRDQAPFGETVCH